MQKDPKAQIRLVVPDSWITELDLLAKSRFITRLALIRLYLRARMNEDLKDLQAHFKDERARLETRRQLEDYYKDKP